MKRNRSDIEFYQNMMDLLQQENASLKEQLDAERKSREEQTRQILEENCALREEIISYAKQLPESEERRNIEQKDLASYAKQLRESEERRNAEQKEIMGRIFALQTELANAMAAVRLGRGKRFAPSSEKSTLANKDRSDNRAGEKDDFDGTPPAGGSSTSTSSESETESGDDQKREKPKREKKISAGRKPSLENYDCDEVVRHELSDYFNLPEGAIFKTRNGLTETHEYISFEYVPGRIIKHIWVPASYQDAIGDVLNTLPKEDRQNPVKGCPFTAQMLAFILVEKYTYHTPQNRIKIKLREMGASFAKSTFVRYYRLAAAALRKMIESTLHQTIRENKYLMIDETCELVRVEDSKTGEVSYRKRYLWAFFDPFTSLVTYLYEQGSRARKVVAKMLHGFMGTIITDGYSAYQIFDTDAHPDVLHCGCWAHVRRKVLESLGVATDVCNNLLSMI